ISIFGATGSVGQSTLDLIDHDPENYDVVALTANRNADALARAARRHCASIAVVADESAYAALKDALAGTGLEGDRKSGVEGKSVSVRVATGGRRNINKK